MMTALLKVSLLSSFWFWDAGTASLYQSLTGLSQLQSSGMTWAINITENVMSYIQKAIAFLWSDEITWNEQMIALSDHRVPMQHLSACECPENELNPDTAAELIFYTSPTFLTTSHLFLLVLLFALNHENVTAVGFCSSFLFFTQRLATIDNKWTRRFFWHCVVL